MDGERHRTFRDALAEVVLTDDLGAAMAHLVEAAALDTHARSVVLVLDPVEGLERLVYETGVVDDAPDELTVEVASRHHRYGQLTARGATRPEGLESYARLAATAIETTVALETAKREAARAHALLELAAGLAECRTITELGQALTAAVPAVVGADRAIFAIDEGEAFRVVAVLGFPERIVGHVGTVESGDDALRNVALYAPGAAAPQMEAFFGALGSTAAVVIPVLVDDVRQGWLYADVVGDPGRLAASPELTARLRGLAAQASTAMRNTRRLEDIRHQAFHDALTGLPNRTLILDRAEHLLARARRDETPVAVLFIDLDGFKTINDTLGHAAGDQFLQSVAARLSATIRETDTLARLGGDEFVVLVEGAKGEAGAELLATRLLDVLAEPFHVEGTGAPPMLVTASIGVATGARASAAELLRDADAALYRAKGRGKNRVVLFSPEAEAAVEERARLETELCRAVEDEDFFLLYEPLLDPETDVPVGARAVLQWHHPERGDLAAETFRDTLERTGLVVPLGRWALATACRQLAAWAPRWQDAGRPPHVAVDLSAQHLFADQVVDDVVDALAASGLAPSQLVVSIGPAAIVEDLRAVAGRVRRIAALGVRVTLDPFLARALGIDVVEDPTGLGARVSPPIAPDDLVTLLMGPDATR